jgi:diguanylate cyclase (GGDEF)-like protein
MKVLIVDAGTAARAKLERQIREWGYEVDQAAGGEEAWNAVKAESRPVLILADWKLPGFSGLELCAKLKQIKAVRQLYFILITPKGGKENIARGLEAGADDYIAKPVEDDELRSRLAIGRRILEYQHTLDNLTHELQSKNLELNKVMSLDGLTGIASRGYFEEKLAEEWRRAWREGSSLSLFLLDIDFFRAYNDTFGHSAGDEALRKVAKTLVASIGRAGDLAARYDGEVFAVILPNTDSLGALVVAEAVRVAIAALGIENKASSIHRHLTVSLGTATVIPDEQYDYQALVTRAESALQMAKAAGRNNVKQA